MFITDALKVLAMAIAFMFFDTCLGLVPRRYKRWLWSKSRMAIFLEEYMN